MIKERANNLGISVYSLLNALPASTLAEKSIMFSPVDEARVMYLLSNANEALQLQYEIQSQHYATFQIASRKAKQNPVCTREDYYWYVLGAFYSLEVKDENKLPAYFVLRLFLKDYLCEKYSLYIDKFCGCNICFSSHRYVNQIPVGSRL